MTGIQGRHMVFFIRRTSQPGKPFFTTEIDCERKKCAYQFRELDCPYYWANARPEAEITDQEAIRYEKHD